MLKFLFKIIIVVIIAIAAVYYHNTESGKELEKTIGKELEYEQLQKRGEKYVDKTIDYIVTKGLDLAKKRVSESIGDKLDSNQTSSSEKDNETQEIIKLDERKKLEQIIEKERDN